jgi:hypothetical protein
MEFNLNLHGPDKTVENEKISISTDFGVTKIAKLNYDAMDAEDKRQQEIERFKSPKSPARPRKK